MPRKKGLPAVEDKLTKVAESKRRQRAANAQLNAPPPDLARLASILARVEADRAAEGLPAPAPDAVVDRACELFERALAIREERARDRERAESGIIVVDRAQYGDDVEAYMHALVVANDRAAERIAALRDRNAYLFGTVEQST